MTDRTLVERLRQITNGSIPLPGAGFTAERFTKLWQIGLESLSLAKLAEAHFDALAILAEAGRCPAPGEVYGVWASQRPNHPLSLDMTADGLAIHGSKDFCSGLGYVDRALVAVGNQLVEVNLREHTQNYSTELSTWSTDAFRLTNTGSIRFDSYSFSVGAKVCEPGWYVKRAGFWNGACGVAACWAGGAEGLVRFAECSERKDVHTLAHLGAMSSALWAMRAIFASVANEIDRESSDRKDTDDCTGAMMRALQLRHIVEQHCTDILRRLARAYGPHPLAMDGPTALRYHALDLFLRQSHAERDLEIIGSKRSAF